VGASLTGVTVTAPLLPAGTKARGVDGDTRVVAVYCVNCESTR